ncbi:MAG: glycosyltransferase family 4 protein [Deltaproteobacteria bacterium]|nr:glycosyltransferase family 4 protein [Deltaproteobacteria bacterium]
MKVLIDGRVLQHKTVSGVERYTKSLIQYLTKTKEIEFDLIKPSSDGKISQHIWEHFYLPFKAIEYDLLFCPANIAPVWIPEGVKLVVTLHSVAYLAASNSYPKMFRKYYKKTIPHIIEIANHIITVSHSEKNRIIHYYPEIKEKISVIYNGIDEKFIQSSSHRDKYILSVISHLSVKNMNLMIDAFNLIKNKIDYNLKIVVSNPYKRENSSFNLSDRITIFYNLPDETLINMYKYASLFVMPSSYESFCFPVLEAIASSLPVVCTPLDAVKEVCGNSVFFSSDFEKESLARAMFTVLTNPYIQDNLRKNRDEVLSLYTWEKTAAEYISLFKKVIMSNEN